MLFVSSPLAFSTDAKIICQAGVANKPMLAAALLQDEGVSPLYTAWGMNAHPDWGVETASHILELGPGLCDDGQMPDTLKTVCKKDAKSLDNARFSVSALLADQIRPFRVDQNARDLPPTKLFAANSPPISCQDLGEPVRPAVVDKSPASSGFSSLVRIRGKADDLYIDRNRQPDGADAFSTVDKASLSLTQDDDKGKRTRLISGVAGLAVPVGNGPLIPLESWDGRMELVPFVGIASNITKVTHTDPKVDQNQRSGGVAFEGTSWSNTMGYWWSIRPQEVWDLTKDSRLFTAALLWRPLFPGRVNTTINPDEPVQYQFLLDFRFNHGHYMDRGELSEDASQDYDRIGGQAGFSLSGGGENYPWTWTTKDAWFYALSGPHKNLSQFSSVLSYTFDKAKLVGVDLTYMAGRDGITGDHDTMWKIALGFRY
jgi:hypothetical protein